ncbi:MAG: PilZ domain-containing protein [Nitrospirota bacterium]|nr:PilZ domain-containing protein [Nitrospirota bacterium]
MHRQRHKRIPVNLRVDISLGSKNHTGVIENVSESGTCISTSLYELATILPGEVLDLKFKAAETEIGLRCTVIWVLINKISGGLRYKMGMEIVEDSPAEYKNFLRTLYL